MSHDFCAPTASLRGFSQVVMESIVGMPRPIYFFQRDVVRHGYIVQAGLI